MFQDSPVTIEYTDLGGRRRTRRIVPIPGSLRFDSNTFHPEPEWLIDVVVTEPTRMLKTFALKDIHSWRPTTEAECCEHGISETEYCEVCNEEYKRALREFEGEA